MTAASLSSADYERALQAAGLEHVRVFHRETTGSTNDDARAIAASLGASSSEAAIVVAEEQTKGRGRGPNAWFSPRGSISLTITTSGVDTSRLGVLPLGVGVCVVEAMRRIGAPAQVKWPNDVLIEGLKVCGILCESSVLSGSARVFIGVGINVDSGAMAPQAGNNATALDQHTLTVDRGVLVADITRRVLDLIERGDAGAEIVERWKTVAVPWWGEPVTFVDGGIEKQVTLLDVSPEGQLVVRDESGVLRSIVSGEIRTLRKAGA